MATYVIKSDLDAAQALLDLQYEVQHKNLDSLKVENIESSASITKVLGSIIVTKTANLPHTSTPIKQQYLSQCWSNSSEEKPVKLTSEKFTQTDFELHVPEIKRMDSVIKRLYAKLETLENKLKAVKREPTSFSDSFEQFTEDSSDSESRYTHVSKKRKRNSTVTTDFSSFADSSYAKERAESLERDVKECKKVLKPKNTLKCNNDMVPIGDGNASVSSRLLKHMDWSSYTNATRKLLTAVFSRKVLATHSLTGKPSPAFPDKPAKKKLDPTLVSDIVQTVVEKCCVPESVVRTSITTKCADESKMFRTRQLNKRKRKSVRKENISPSDESEDSFHSYN